MDFSNKKSDKHSEQYPIELPSRSNISKNSPIVDVVEHETFPMQFANCHRGKPHFDTNEDISDTITEVVTTEIEPEKAEQTTHGRQM